MPECQRAGCTSPAVYRRAVTLNAAHIPEFVCAVHLEEIATKFPYMLVHYDEVLEADLTSDREFPPKPSID